MADYPSGEFELPLFPLANLVFFPHTRLPLHVFEPRYRRMVNDVLTNDLRIGVILLRPGWEDDYFGNPPVHDIGTLGVVEQAVPREEGKFDILLRGDVRFRVLASVRDEPYRVARVITVPEQEVDIMEAYAQREWLVDLSRRYLEFLPDQAEVPELDTASLDSLTNALVMSLNLEMGEKQELLELDGIAPRAQRVGDLMQQRIEMMQFLGPWRNRSDPSRN